MIVLTKDFDLVVRGIKGKFQYMGRKVQCRKNILGDVRYVCNNRHGLC
jgi:hypothetical protein